MLSRRSLALVERKSLSGIRERNKKEKMMER